MKKFLCVICIAIFGIIFFAGCADVSYSVLMYSDGSIEQGFEVDLDKSAIEAGGYNYQDVTNEIVRKIEQVVQLQNIRILAFKSNLGVQTSNIKLECNYKIVDEQTYYAYMYFGSNEIFTAYNKFVTGEEPNPDEDKEILEENLFYIKHINKTTTVYYDLENNQFAKDMLAYFDGSKQGTTKFTLNDVNYNFFYGVPTNKIHSNSDARFRQDGMTIHCWRFSADETNNEIMLYTIEVKPMAWYLLALALTFIFLLILGVVVLIQKKCKKNKNIIADEIN